MTAMKVNAGAKLVLVFVYVLAATYVYWLFYGRPVIGIDDANIYMVYMRNFSKGMGFVYNAGGERVEGFTSLLWTVAGGFFYLFRSEVGMLLLAFNIIIITFTLWRLVLFTDRFFDDKRILSPYSLFILGALFVAMGYFDWTILTLMETGFWSLLLVSIIIELCDRELRGPGSPAYVFPLLLVLLVVTRPESLLWGVFFLVIRWWQLYRERGGIGAAVRGVSVAVICFFGAVVLLLLFRLVYFGYPFPNTYYAKVSPNKLYNLVGGIKYVGHFLWENKPVILLFFFLPVHLYRLARKKERSPRENALLIIVLSCLLTLLIPLYTGGDHFSLNRFIQPIMPWFFFLLAYSFSFYNLGGRAVLKGYVSGVVFIAGVLALSKYSPLFSESSPIRFEFSLAEDGRRDGGKLGSLFQGCSPLPVQGVIAAGGAAYAYKGATIDVLGLNNVAIAHSGSERIGMKDHASFDKKVFMRLRPDLFFTEFLKDTTGYVLLENKQGFEQSLVNQVLKGILKEEGFRKIYFPVLVLKKGETGGISTYTTENFIRRLDRNVYDVIYLKR